MKLFILSFLVLQLLFISGQSQSSPATNDLNFHMDRNIRMMKDPGNHLLSAETYLINGRNVLGSPFLYNIWLAGKIVTSDNRLYEHYKLKYDAYHQVLHFQDGNQSLEINEPVQSFTLNYKDENISFTYTFVYFEKVEKQSKPVFLELISDGSQATLYRLNKMVTVNLSKALPNTMANEQFDLKTFYYLMNKQKNKMKLVTPGGNNVEGHLGVKLASVPGVVEKLNTNMEEALMLYVKFLNQSR